jgi:hypothetical protein
VGLPFSLGLLALIHGLIPLLPVLEPRLQFDQPEQLIVCYALYRMLLVSIGFHVLAVAIAETATLAMEPILDGNDSLQG